MAPGPAAVVVDRNPGAEPNLALHDFHFPLLADLVLAARAIVGR
jgi:hypothetical protein